ncbi:bacteriochlorophyll 4-vinyl reductase [Blastochloris viridis]|uniref:Bacteriochlorophyll 4-vinyl reductase n=1 Tax=Blastochloris viridis TaxID=1079 RepID=A0A0H5B7K1_BLAVI|nr:bacteriochlorophyll 4-vinyl reductase [Blastochloris viridis]ALK08562.1 V4R domain protein [Blastochloris viridis]BAR98150.1 protein BchJ [Blastochloris viridis]CUU41225.1 bacteriochlorophyll 4-vinyl reductase [Blastochloris viridis]
MLVQQNGGENTGHDAGHDTGDVARIGPNSITRVAEALETDVGRDETVALFQSVGLEGYLASPPNHMVDDREVMLLHQALRSTLGLERAREIAREAGRTTGDYLLAHRIPRGVQILLKMLPPSPAARLLMAAIRRNAWTFTGGGAFHIMSGSPLRFTIAGGPISRGATSDVPVCDYYASTFQRLFQVLVSPAATVVEIACEALGDPACVFEVRWG